MSSRRVRRLLVGPETYRWRVHHRHTDGTDCREILTLRREGDHGILRIVFHDGPGLIVPDGYMHSGGVTRADAAGHLNLHRPRHVRALLDAALAGGATFDAQREIDGWGLFDTALAAVGSTS